MGGPQMGMPPQFGGGAARGPLADQMAGGAGGLGGLQNLLGMMGGTGGAGWQNFLQRAQAPGAMPMAGGGGPAFMGAR